MRRELAICLILTAAALAPVPVSAQALLPPYEIVTSVRSMGLTPVSSPVRRGQRYELIATDRRGVGVKVAADGFSGRILFIEELGSSPVRATRAYPDEAAPPRDSYQRQGSAGSGEPSVIYADPRDNNPPRPSARVPSTAKPPVPKVAAKPPAKLEAPAEPAASAEKPASEPPSDTTGSTTAVAPPPPAEKSPALTAPPVQGFD